MAWPGFITDALGQSTAAETTKVLAFVGEPWVLACAIIFIIAAIILAIILKRLIINSLVGLVAWAIISLLGVKLPFLASLIVSAIFGLAGIGVMLLLRFLGVL